MKTLQDITLDDLLPDSISSDQQVKQSAEAIDPELKTVSGFLLLGAVLANVDKLTIILPTRLTSQLGVIIGP